MASRVKHDGGFFLTREELTSLETMILEAHSYNETGTSHRDVVVALETILSVTPDED